MEAKGYTTDQTTQNCCAKINTEEDGDQEDKGA